MRRTALLLASTAVSLLLVGLALLVGGQGEARAAFPGQNGRIVYSGFYGYDEDASLYSDDPNDASAARVRITYPDPGAARDSYPDVSPDGTRVAFLRIYWGGEDCAPHVINIDGTGLKDLSDDDPATCEGTPKWTTDGKIAFESGGQTYVVNPDGSGRAPIGSETRVSDPALSPDGRKRAVGCDYEGQRTICIENADGSGRRPVDYDLPPTPTEQDVEVLFDDYPVWSPDGSRIAFQREEAYTYAGNYSLRIATMRADGSDARYVSKGFVPGFATDPAWQPLGTGTGAPETTIISSPSAVTGASKSFDFVASKPNTTFECSLDGATFRKCWAPTEYSDLGAGSHTFRVRARDASGNADPTPAQRAWTVDATAPVVKGPTRDLVVGSVIGNSTTPARLSWSATDSGGSGLARYELQQSTNGGAFANVTLPSETTTAIAPSLESGKTYQYRVRARDKAGNLSAWKTGPAFAVDLRQEDHQSVAYTGSWALRSSPTASGGYVKYASAAGAKARFSFAAKNVAWVASTGSNRGKAEVWVDGVKSATVDLYAATAQPRKMLFTKSWSASGNHTLEVRVLGTKNTASTGKQVDVDAFVALR